MVDQKKITICSSFTSSNFVSVLKRDTFFSDTTFKEISYSELILNPSSLEKSSALFLWTLPHHVLQSYLKVANGESFDTEALVSDVKSYADFVIGLASSGRAIFIPLWVFPSTSRSGPIELTSSKGIFRALMQANMLLLDALCNVPNIYPLYTQRWIESLSAKGAPWSPKLWYMAKVPFVDGVFQEATKDLRATITAIIGQTKKVIVVDLDDTLWGGIVGDDGWENLQLGGHDPIGEAFVDFQKNLLKLFKRGIALAIVSKNDERVALESIQKHPEMILREEYFAAWRINWNDKAQNIVEIAHELNLGLDAFVFLDDNPVERGRVSEMLPMVTVPELPINKLLYADFLSSLPYFDSVAITEEDAMRGQMYVTERQRETLKTTVSSPQAWLESLGLELTIEPLTRSNVLRAAQLLNKTNQMNLSTRRLETEQLWDWASIPHNILYTFSVSDRFGSYGLTGLASISIADKQAVVVDFILSCRVFSRNVEEAMLAVLCHEALKAGCSFITLTYQETAKNNPTKNFLERIPCNKKSDNEYCLDLSIPFPVPNIFTMKYKASAD